MSSRDMLVRRLGLKFFEGDALYDAASKVKDRTLKTRGCGTHAR